MGRKAKKKGQSKAGDSDEENFVGTAVESLDADDPIFKHDMQLKGGKLSLNPDDDDNDDDDMFDEDYGKIDPADLESSEESDDDDDEEDSEEEDEDLETGKAWGKKASAFYGADYVDDGLGSGSEDEEAALAEGREAEALQMQEQEQLSMEDFAWGKDDADPHDEDSAEAESSVKKNSEGDEVATLEELVQSRSQEADDVLVLLNKARKLPQTHNNKELVKYLGNKYQILLISVQHIQFYCHILTKPMPGARHHPVVKTIIKDHNLVERWERYGKDLRPMIKALENNEDVAEAEKEVRRALRKAADRSGDNGKRLTKSQKKNLQKKRSKAAAKTGKVKRVDGVAMDSAGGQPDENDVEDLPGKRAITYEMAKNKGLTPHRKKEVRNPRVKMRKKFEKASTRRKSQVRPVKTQSTQYMGEATGIRSHLTRSVKF